MKFHIGEVVDYYRNFFEGRKRASAFSKPKWHEVTLQRGYSSTQKQKRITYNVKLSISTCHFILSPLPFNFNISVARNRETFAISERSKEQKRCKTSHWRRYQFLSLSLSLSLFLFFLFSLFFFLESHFIRLNVSISTISHASVAFNSNYPGSRSPTFFPFPSFSARSYVQFYSVMPAIMYFNVHVWYLPLGRFIYNVFRKTMPRWFLIA